MFLFYLSDDMEDCLRVKNVFEISRDESSWVIKQYGYLLSSFISYTKHI